jgi:hypothetical protein
MFRNKSCEFYELFEHRTIDLNDIKISVIIVHCNTITVLDCYAMYSNLFTHQDL